MNTFALLNFVALNLALLFSAVLLLNSKSESNRPKLLLSTTLTYFALIILIELGLGIFGILNIATISFSTYLLTTIVTYKKRKEIKSLLSNIFQKPKMDKSQLIFGLAIFMPAIVLFGLRFYNAIFLVPFDYDAINYHLPIVIEWLQSGSILQPFYTFFSGPLGHYPANYELIYLWVTIPFQNDLFISLTNFPLLILLPTLIYYICQNWNFNKYASLIAAAIPLYIPIFMHQAGLIFVDLFFTVLLFFSFYFLQEIYKNPKSNQDKILFGLALGLFMGTKYLAIIYAIFPILLYIFIHFKKKIKHKTLIYPAVATFITGSFFYLRNWIDSGNPIFPASVKIGSQEIFKGSQTTADFLEGSDLFSNLLSVDSYGRLASELLINVDYIGILLLTAFIPTLIITIVQLIRKDKKLPISILLLSSALFFGLAFIRSPYTYVHFIYNVRYAMPLFIIATINWAYLISLSKKFSIFLIATTLVFLFRSYIYAIHIQEFKMQLIFELLSWYKTHLIIFATALLLLFALTPILKSKYSKSIVSIFSIFLLFFVMNFAYQERESLIDYTAEKWYPKDNFLYGDFRAALWFNKNAPTAKIAYVPFNFVYHFYGRDLSREVDYINVNDCPGCDYSDYEDPDAIRGNPDFDSWMSNLKLANKEYLVISPEQRGGYDNIEQDWIKENPKKFQTQKVFNDIKIYKIRY